MRQALGLLFEPQVRVRREPRCANLIALEAKEIGLLREVAPARLGRVEFTE